ncbi:hypothetical protein WK62_04045 [Burkholderia ubonensis]|uniref:hypothetical protein n=1 Tax=Burkholderia ubonensis TaxID=101571 RepID=UPI00075C410E|nr:hypothetical protein [Burkholderia ubonensis]KVU11834.1 hypothetical protein WK62_04045 [Burkholderia ubonensis]
MAFQLSVATVASLKRRFRVAFPLYRSAHLHEALAYGFGYRTSAALQADLKQSDAQALHADFEPWRMHERLVEIGYVVDPNEFEHAFVTAIPAAQSLFSAGHPRDRAPAAPDELEPDRPRFDLRNFVDWDRQPSISREIEGTYRRAYHQAIASAAYAMRGGHQTAERLLQWVEGPGMKWRKDGDLAFRELPPPL